MKKYLITDEKLTDIGDAIREKTGKTDLIPVDQMDEEIRSIQVGVDTSDATAAPGELLVGKTAYVNEQKITGTMADNGAVSQNLNAGGSYTIPAGYHNGQGKVNANSLASQTSGTAAAVDIASGKTAYVNGEKITGEGEMARDLASEISTQDDLITQIVTALDGKAGVALPVLSNPAGAANIEAGYQAIDGAGNMVVGGMECYKSIETVYDGDRFNANQNITLDPKACYIVFATTYYSDQEIFYGVIKNGAFIVQNMPVGSKYWTFNISNNVLQINKSIYSGFYLGLTKIV